MNWSPDPQSLRGRIAVVAGATRGAGRGIALALGEAGATVICTGRSTRALGSSRSDYDRPETIDETAELVTRLGGQRHRDRGRPSQRWRGENPRGTDRRRSRPHRYPGERHLGGGSAQGRPQRVEHAGVEARSRQRVPDPASWHRYARDHVASPAAARHQPAGRTPRGSDRRDLRVQHHPLPAFGVLRPGQDFGQPAGLLTRTRTETAWRHRGVDHAGMAAFRDDAREFRRLRRTMARRARSHRVTQGSRRASPCPSRRATSDVRSPRSPPIPTVNGGINGR